MRLEGNRPLLTCSSDHDRSSMSHCYSILLPHKPHTLDSSIPLVSALLPHLGDILGSVSGPSNQPDFSDVVLCYYLGEYLCRPSNTALGSLKKASAWRAAPKYDLRGFWDAVHLPNDIVQQIQGGKEEKEEIEKLFSSLRLALAREGSKSIRRWFSESPTWLSGTLRVRNAYVKGIK